MRKSLSWSLLTERSYKVCRDVLDSHRASLILAPWASPLPQASKEHPTTQPRLGLGLHFGESGFLQSLGGRQRGFWESGGL